MDIINSIKINLEKIKIVKICESLTYDQIAIYIKINKNVKFKEKRYVTYITNGSFCLISEFESNLELFLVFGLNISLQNSPFSAMLIFLGKKLVFLIGKGVDELISAFKN